jgi:hypothetical protein
VARTSAQDYGDSLATSAGLSAKPRRTLWTTFPTIAAFLCLVAVVAGCDGSSGTPKSSAANTSSPAPPSSSPTPTPLPGVAVGKDPETRLQVDSWGSTKDGLLSVIVSNVGHATVRSARAIISAEDAHGNIVAAVSAQAGTPLGVRCCTIIGLDPGKRYGLYSNIGTRISRVKHVSVDYTSVRTDVDNVTSPVLSMSHADLSTNGNEATVFVTVKMSQKVGPYITVQALLDGADGTLLGVISGGFYCLAPNTTRTIKLQFFHPVPAGSTVDSVVSFPLDADTARIEKLKRCNAG